MSKRVFKIFLIVCIVIISVLVAIILLTQEKTEEITEYTPQEEISEEQLRQTLVTLYFKNKDAGHIMPEARLIDAKLLLENPYITLVEFLVEGPKNSSLERLIPEGTKVNKAVLNKNTVELDLSIEFIKDVSLGKEEEQKIIQSIVSTLFELTEVDSVKITIDGEENKSFADNGVDFKTIFVKEEK